MSGGTTQQTQSSTESSPWAPSIPYLTNILGQIGQGNLAPTTEQQAAAGLTSSEAGTVPSYGPEAEKTLSGLFGFNTSPEATGLASAAGTTANTLSPYLSANFTNPMTNPNLSRALATIGQQTQQNVDSLFAAAGRDPAGNADAGKAAATAVTNAEAPILTGEYNTLVGEQLQAAQNNVSNAGNVATEEANLSAMPLTMGLQGITGASALPGLITMPGTAAMTAANLEAGLPWDNLTSAEGLVDPIAALGGQSMGNSTTTTNTSALSNILAGGLGLAGLMAAPMTGGGSLGGSLFSGLFRSPFSSSSTG